MRNSLKAKDQLQLTDPPTVSVTLSWIPGFNGGLQVEFTLKLRKKGHSGWQELNIGNPGGNQYTAKDLKTATTYEFSMYATNSLGPSADYEPYLEFTTKGKKLLLL